MGSRKDEAARGRFLRIFRWVAIPISAAAATALVTYFLASAYIFRQAEANIHDVLLSHRGLHLYIQRTMHPQFFKDIDEGRIPEDYYSPVLFSSSYMVRVMHGFFNEERIKDGLPSVYYKMAADNPRNPVNQATALESRLIQRFNEHRELTQHREEVTVEGRRYLLHAIPFLENNAACLRCHGRREEAPLGLRALYPGEGGFNEKVGMIRAVEVIRAPLDREIQMAVIASAAITGGLLALMALFMFSTRLRLLVRVRTAELEEEVRERRHAEAEVRNLNRDLEQRVEARTAQLSAANRELDAFAYSVSHDLRAPLRAIDGFSRALVEDCAQSLDETGKGYLERVRKSCQHMASLIEDLLHLSRLSRRELETQEVDLSDLAREVAETLSLGTPERHTEFTIEPGLTAQGDPTLLRDVLDNLMGNAFKFSSKTPRAKVEFGRTESRGQAAYFVRDNGAGFDMQYADKLFGTFQRLHSREEFEGSGIGLATVHRILTRHGGQIWAESRPNEGATFFFTIQ